MKRLIGKWNEVLTPQRSGASTDVGLLVLRLSLGGMMAFSHGLGKMDKLLAGGEIRFADPIGIGMGPSLALAGSAEFFCSLAIAVGLLTRLAAVPLAFTMLVAAFVVHGADPFAKQEFALVYLAGYVALIFTGPGRYSVDAVLHRRFSAK